MPPPLNRDVEREPRAAGRRPGVRPLWDSLHSEEVCLEKWFLKSQATLRQSFIYPTCQLLAPPGARLSKSLVLLIYTHHHLLT